MVVLRGDLIKCVVVGDDNVGKTSMLMCYATNRFPSQHVPNVFDNYAGSVVLSGKQYTLQMIDTTEQYNRQYMGTWIRTSLRKLYRPVICSRAVVLDPRPEAEGHYDCPEEKGESDESRRQSYSGADVFLVCFSVVKPETLVHVQRRWLPEIRQLMGETPVILIGTQTDMRDDETVLNDLRTKGERPISAREAAAFSRRVGAACYMESSPAMKKRMKRVMNEAFVSVFSHKDDHTSVGCTIL